jgi:hypothetical protein
MKSKNVGFVPTDKSSFLIKEYLKKMGTNGDLDGRVNKRQSRAKNRLALAREAGITILVGSDSYVNFDTPQGETAKQILIALEEEGMRIHWIFCSQPIFFLYNGWEWRVRSVFSKQIAGLIS